MISITYMYPTVWTGDTTNSTNIQTEVNDPPTLTTDAVVKVIYLVIGGAGLAGNLLVVAVLLNQSSKLKSFTNMYILNQSAIDGTVSVMLLLTTLLETRGRHLEGTADDALCRMWLTKLPLWSILMSSSYNLVVMTTERYLAVVHSICHKVSMTRRKVVMSMLAAWIVGPLYLGAFEIPTTRIVGGRCYLWHFWPNQLTRQAVGVVTVTVQYVIPLLILTTLYTKMAIGLQRRIRPLEGVNNPTGSEATTTIVCTSMARARGNVIKTLAIVSSCYVLSWTCNQTYFLAFNLGHRLSLSSPFYHFTVIAVYVNSCINPVVYAVKYEQYKRALRGLVRRVTCRKVTRIMGSETAGAGNTESTIPQIS